MGSLLGRLPWFVSTPVIVAAIAVFAVFGNVLIGVYFERTTLNEANPLAGVGIAPRGTDAAPGTTGASPEAAVLAKGPVKDGEPGHFGKGEATIIRTPNGDLTLRFEQFSVTNGPDLFVYLVEDPKPGRAAVEAGLNLGRLKATDGNFNYAIPGGTDVSRFGSAVIWCRQFRVNFALATFEDAGKRAAPSAAQAAVNAATTLEAAPTVANPTAAAGASAPAATPAASTPTPPAATPTATESPAASTPPPSSGAALLLQGTFRDGAPGHRGSGTAKIGRDANGKLVLVMENFSVTNGPDLHVILGPSASGGGAGLDLGKLKATDGTFSYQIPAGTDLSQFKSVTVWCSSFPTIFTYATLEV